jgi:hypothetical protein
MIEFCFRPGFAPNVDPNIASVSHIAGRVVVLIQWNDAVLSGLFRQAALCRSCLVCRAGFPEYRVPAYRWYGQLVVKPDALSARLNGRYARIADWGKWSEAQKEAMRKLIASVR